MKTIAISFSLKGQSFPLIAKNLEKISQQVGPCVLIHGNLPKKEVEKRGLSTDVIDKLDELFPIQLNMWNGKVLRDDMGSYAKSLNAEIYVIGNINYGVKEEVDIYKNLGLAINHFLIN